jgi:Ca2+-transporting ATPase
MIGALALGLGAWYYFSGRPEWQTMIFTSLAFMQVFQALASRSSKDSLFKLGVMSNPLLAGMALLVLLLQMLVIYVPALSGFFEVVPLNGCDLSIAAAAGVIVFVVMELGKRRREAGD